MRTNLVVWRVLFALVLVGTAFVAGCAPAAASGPSDLPSWVKPGTKVELLSRAMYGVNYENSVSFGPSTGEVAVIARGGLFGRGDYVAKFDGYMGTDAAGRPKYHEKHGQWVVRVSITKQTKLFGRTINTNEVGWIFLANVRPVPTAVPTPAQPKP